MGIREFSTTRIMKMLKTTRINDGPGASHEDHERPPIISDKEKLFDKTTRLAKFRKNERSDRHENAASRLAPMPSKLDPVSIAARIIKNLAIAKKAVKRITSPKKWIGAFNPPNGINKEAVKKAVRDTKGAARKIHVVVRL